MHNEGIRVFLFLWKGLLLQAYFGRRYRQVQIRGLKNYPQSTDDHSGVYAGLIAYLRASRKLCHDFGS